MAFQSIFIFLSICRLSLFRLPLAFLFMLQPLPLPLPTLLSPLLSFNPLRADTIYASFEYNMFSHLFQPITKRSKIKRKSLFANFPRTASGSPKIADPSAKSRGRRGRQLRAAVGSTFVSETDNVSIENSAEFPGSVQMRHRLNEFISISPEKRLQIARQASENSSRSALLSPSARFSHSPLR